MSRICIIGDVHGMTDLLVLLVDRLALTQEDTLVSLGDLVDKGPDPVGTVRYLGNLARDASFQVVLVAANHEDRHLRYQRNRVERPAIAAAMAAMARELPKLDAELTEDDRAFLKQALPFWRAPNHDILCVHGGIPGNMAELPPTPEAAAALTGKRRRTLQQILRTRYIDAKTGAFLSLGKEEPGDPFWAEVYDGRFGHVVFGHQPFFDGPGLFPHATGIDTGAAHGGALTALVIDVDGQRSFETVPASAGDKR
ncbi:MAG: metallophosphoesterase [Pseudomonadota bacterium]